MTTGTTTLTAWLLEQIAADESGTARAYRDLAESLNNQCMSLAARWLLERRTRTLATCAAHRAIIESAWGDHVRIESEWGHAKGQSQLEADNDYPPSLIALASIYADRPGYDPDWP